MHPKLLARHHVKRTDEHGWFCAAGDGGGVLITETNMCNVTARVSHETPPT